MRKSMLFRGYIDESYDENVFSLSCILMHCEECLWVEWEWEKCLEKWNRRLASEGRKQLTRYHAADCNSRKNEFKGWSVSERDELTADLIPIVRDRHLLTLGYGIDMKKFFKVFPSFKRKPHRKSLELMYGMMTKFLVYTLANYELDPVLDATVSLVHDRSPFDGFMRRAFNQCRAEDTFKHRDMVTCLTSRSSMECIPLQCADFFSFMNFKSAQGVLSGQKRSRPLELIIAGNKLSGGVKFIGIDALRALKIWLQRQVRLKRKKRKR